MTTPNDGGPDGLLEYSTEDLVDELGRRSGSGPEPTNINAYRVLMRTLAMPLEESCRFWATVDANMDALARGEKP